MQRQGIDAGSLEQAYNALRALQSAGPYDDPDEVARLLENVRRGLQDFEFNLRQALDDAARQKLFLAAPGEVPVEYRKAVEEYYRSLSRKR